MPANPPALPDQWDYLVHWVERADSSPAPTVTTQVRAMPGRERLLSILTAGELHSHKPHTPTRFRAQVQPSVSFTEAVQGSLEQLLADRRVSPWGIVFPKSVIWDLGGGPVWYARDDVYNDPTLDRVARNWAVRTTHPATGGAGTSRWSHEREWRLHEPDGDPFPFSILDVHAVIVPEAEFTGPNDEDEEPSGPRIEQLVDDMIAVVDRGRASRRPSGSARSRRVPGHQYPHLWFWSARRRRLWAFPRFGDRAGTGLR
jgi:hypothetical protein